MTWFKVDDSFYDHPKVFDAPDCAVALWTRAGSWSARNLTDGFVPTGMPARLCIDHETAVAELVRRGLWVRAKDGYRFRDWSDYQPTRDEVLAERKRWADKKASQRAAKRPETSKPRSRAKVSPHVSPGDSPMDSRGDSPLESSGESRGPVPSRPVPDSPYGESKNSPRDAQQPHIDDGRFAEFWSTYPKREARAAAQKAWAKAIKRGEPEVIIAGAAAYRDLPDRDPRFTKNPATWLNADCWLDERLPNPRAAPNGQIDQPEYYQRYEPGRD
jgi:hypothetical protein